jgi:preprotein translocase subunit SecA
MFDRQIDLACERYLDSDYGAASFAEFAANRLGVEFDAADFSRSDFTEADKTARDKAMRVVETQVYEMMEENLGSEDSKEWNWQALANQVNTRWNLKTNERQLRQIGKDDMADYLREAGQPLHRRNGPERGPRPSRTRLGRALAVRLGAAEVPDQARPEGPGRQG